MFKLVFILSLFLIIYGHITKENDIISNDKNLIYLTIQFCQS